MRRWLGFALGVLTIALAGCDESASVATQPTGVASTAPAGPKDAPLVARMDELEAAFLAALGDRARERAFAEQLLNAAEEDIADPFDRVLMRDFIRRLMIELARREILHDEPDYEYAAWPTKIKIRADELVALFPADADFAAAEAEVERLKNRPHAERFFGDPLPATFAYVKPRLLAWEQLGPDQPWGLSFMNYRDIARTRSVGDLVLNALVTEQWIRVSLLGTIAAWQLGVRPEHLNPKDVRPFNALMSDRERRKYHLSPIKRHGGVLNVKNLVEPERFDTYRPPVEGWRGLMSVLQHGWPDAMRAMPPLRLRENVETDR